MLPERALQPLLTMESIAVKTGMGLTDESSIKRRKTAAMASF
jgi:hypothetical protein